MGQQETDTERGMTDAGLGKAGKVLPRHYKNIHWTTGLAPLFPNWPLINSLGGYLAPLLGKYEGDPEVDENGDPLDGGKSYKVVFPKGIPAEKFWSVTVYNMQTRSIIQTDQKFPKAGSQSFPTSAAQENEDGSTTVYYGPTKPANIPEGNWIQTNANEGWFQILRCYSPGKAFFDKTWRAGEVELIK